MAVLAIYKYYYGIVEEPNRSIEFQRNQQAGSIIAIIKAMRSGKEEEISRISGKDINVEMMTTSDKVQALMAQRDGKEPTNRPDCKLSDLNIQQQDSILSQLEPKGKWRIEITNTIGNTQFFEKVESLNLFNPS